MFNIIVMYIGSGAWAVAGLIAIGTDKFVGIGYFILAALLWLGGVLSEILWELKIRREKRL